ncbi:hypothetical protein ACI8AF_26310 [Blastococcus sp. SYSU D00669]
MPGAIESRAAVFTSSPQAVEAYSAGEWLPGSLLGWRHDAEGGCQVWVRLAVGDVEESVWTDLDCLRLPERHLTVAPAPAADAVATVTEAVVEDLAATRSMRLTDVSATGPARRGRPAAPGAARAGTVSDLAATRGFPAVRDDAASRASHPAGRRRRADSRVVGETAEFPAVGVAVPSGRHRAPASPSGSGRHRAADTGVLAAVTEEPVRVPAPRLPEVVPSPEPDLYTRPMRLDGVARGGSAPRPRAVHRDDTLTGV